MSRRLQISLAAVAYIVIALALQWKAGTAKADFTLHPDESAHLVTGMMVRDYFAQHLGESPMVYAKAYYATYPKIAIGHYPPMFYIVEGAWFLLWPPSALSITVLTALLAAMVALLEVRQVKRASALRRATSSWSQSGGEKRERSMR